MAGKAAERQVGEFGSTTHMADGEGHTHNIGVKNTSRCGEEAGEEERRGVGGKRNRSFSIIQKERYTHSRPAFKKNNSS